MKILYLESVSSTQDYIKNLLKDKKIKVPYAVVSDIQTNGVGSRGNQWQGIKGNLFLSFAITIKDLPSDLRLESSSIYFAYLLKETLFEFGSKVWLKWPNDFYLDNLKLGGVICNIVNDTLICGIGLNLVDSPNGFAKLDIEVSKEELLEKYFIKIKKDFPWKQVFSKYKLEFYKSKDFYTHGGDIKISLEDATLFSDGSIMINDERIYSLR